MARYLGLSLSIAMLSLLAYNLERSELSRRGTPPRHASADLVAAHLDAVEAGQQDTTLPLTDDVSRADPREIDQFIQQLSSSSFAEREEATRRLEKIGDPAVKALRTASAKGADLELRRRAEQLISDILNKDFGKRFNEDIASVERRLPPGWSVTRTISGSTPPDWWTEDPKSGFLVEARSGEEVIHLWFLPMDWIGIRKTQNRAWHSVYGQGVLMGDQYKIIAVVNDEDLRKRLSHLVGGSWSLVNGGYDQALRVFAGKLESADRIASRLVRKYCHTPKQLHEAIASLNDLGVPAHTLFLNCARKARGEDRSRYTSLLGLMGGKEAIGLLCDIATDLEVSAYERKYAVLALDGYQDRRIGPAVHTALKQMPDGEGLHCVAKTLMHLHYKAAEMDALARFKQTDNNSYGKGTLAQTLAAFRCKEAIPELRRLRQELSNDPKKYKGLLESLDLALLRLTGDWGEASEHARLFVVAPQPPHLGEKMELTVHLENQGSEPIEIDPLPREIGLSVDGKPVFKQKILVISGMVIRVDPGEVWTFTCDLTPYVKTPGRHEVQYAIFGARSNVTTISVKAARW